MLSLLCTLAVLWTTDAIVDCSGGDGQCGAEDKSDTNAMLQTRVLVASEQLEPEREEEPYIHIQREQEACAQEASAQDPILGVSVDHLGLLQSAGPEPELSSSDPLLGPEPLAEGDELPMDYADTEEMQPYREELIELEAANDLFEERVERDEWAEDLEEEAAAIVAAEKFVRENSDNEGDGQKEEIKPLLRNGLKFHDLRQLGAEEEDDEDDAHGDREEEDTDREHHDVSLIGASDRGQHVEGRAVKITLVQASAKCRAHNEYLGNNFATPEKCGQEVMKKGGLFFMYGKDRHRNRCYVSEGKLGCPEGMETTNQFDYYTVTDDSMPAIYDVSPQEGSIAGGQTVTITGYNLYVPHSEMSGTGGKASDLMPPIRIFLGNIECPMDTFESRPESIKCITKPLEKSEMNVTDVWMPVIVMKVKDGKPQEVTRQGKDSNLRYRFSTGATAEVAFIHPLAVGPGEVLKLNAWSCSGYVEAEPLVLHKPGTKPKDETGNGTGTDADETALVEDPEEAWGHICEPFPSFEHRYKVTTSAEEAVQDTASEEEQNMNGAPTEELGSPGLYARFYQLKAKEEFPSNVKKIEEYLNKKSISDARLFIKDRPLLPYNTFYLDIKKPYVTFMSAYLKISTAGRYHFRMNTLSVGFIKIDSDLLVDNRRRKKPEAGWGHHHELHSKPLELSKGWHQIAFAHSASLGHPHHSALEIRYHGPDTSNRWVIIPANVLRSGVNEADLAKLDFEARVASSAENLVPAKESPYQKVTKRGAGKLKCPDGAHPKLVEFMCKVDKDMPTGFYDVQFKDHLYGSSISDSAQWSTGMGAQKATLRVVPAIDEIVQLDSDSLIVKGAGLDGIKQGPFTFNKHSYELANSTQDHLELKKSASPVPEGSTPSLMGSRGLLREIWFDDAWPAELKARGSKSSWMRSSIIRTSIMQVESVGPSGFSERLTGVFSPPHTATCRFRMQGTMTHHHYTKNYAKLYIGDRPMNAGSDEPAEAASKLAQPVLSYAGREYQRNKGDNIAESLGKNWIGSATSFAMEARWDFVHNNWHWALDTGDIKLGFHGHPRWRKVSFMVNGRRMDSGMRFELGRPMRILVSITERGYARVFVNGALAAVNGNMPVPQKKARSIYIGQRNFKGLIKNFMIFNKVVSWDEVFQPSAQGGAATTGKLVKPDCMCHRQHYIGDFKTDISACASAAAKLGLDKFFFGKKGSVGRCYRMDPNSCRLQQTHYHHDYDLYKVVQLSAADGEDLPVPEEPAVFTDNGHLRVSAWMDFEKGKPYPFMLDRKLAGLSDNTGADGWKTLGLECKKIEGAEALLPKASYLVSMEMREYPVLLTLPKSPRGYRIAFRENQKVVRRAADVWGSFNHLLGGQCRVSGGGSHKKLMTFDDLSKIDGKSACGVGMKTTPAAYSYFILATESDTGKYRLREKPYLHICYNVPPGATVNMLVKAQVGWRKRVEMFSIGMTDSRVGSFDRERKRAAQFNIVADEDGKTKGTWECTSINLHGQLTDYESYEKRFCHNIPCHGNWQYRRNAVDRHRDAPGPNLENVYIHEIALGSAIKKNGKWEPLLGTVSIDMLGWSSEKFTINILTPAPMKIYPIKSMSTSGSTGSGWKVEWFGDDTCYWNKPGKSSAGCRKPDVTTYNTKLEFYGCRAAWKTRRCDRYGWRATGKIEIPSAGGYRFSYKVDDHLKVWVDGKEVEHYRCCKRNWVNGKKVVTLTAGMHDMEVHFLEGGGGDYGALRWKKEGTSDYLYTVAPEDGISQETNVEFWPRARKEFANLKALVEEFKVLPIGTVSQEVSQLEKGQAQHTVMEAGSGEGSEDQTSSGSDTDAKTDGTRGGSADKSSSTGQWIEYSQMKASQSSTGWGGSANRCLTNNVRSRWSGSCTHTKRDNKAWWKVTLQKPVEVKKVTLTNRRGCCANRLYNVGIFVGGKKCSTATVRDGQTKEFPCVATGKEIKVQHRGRNYLTICGFKLFAAPFTASCGHESFQCDPGYSKMANASAVENPTNTKCCEVTCAASSFRCDDGYGKKKIASLNAMTNPTNAKCCEVLTATVTLPKGMPPLETVTVVKDTVIVSSWDLAVRVTSDSVGDWNYDESSLSRADFNARFRKCPVVRYVRDGQMHSIYVRKTALPANFDAMHKFTESWTDSSNKFKQDFNLYSSLDDVKSQRAWTYCDFHGGVGYPYQCGKTGRDQQKKYFQVPEKGGPFGSTDVRFELYSGSTCPSPVGEEPEVSDDTQESSPKSVTFDMDDSSENITKMIKAAGFGKFDVDVLGSDRMEWLELRGAPVLSSSGDARNPLDDKGCWEKQETHPWVSVKLGGTYEVVAVRITGMQDMKIAIDGKECGKTTDAGWQTVPCIGEGSTLLLSRMQHMKLCGLKVAVAAAKNTASNQQRDSFVIKITSSTPGPMKSALKFTSSLAETTETKVLSTGARYWSDLTDYWFRMPYKHEQVQLGDWHGYISTGPEGNRVRPATENESQTMNATSLLSVFTASHAARGSVSALQRRMPMRRWRLPPRYHTLDTLETLRRKVLGVQGRPNGWKETASLLQVHAGKQRQFTDGTLDPRDDQNALRWSDPKTWGGEEPPTGKNTDIVYIPEGKTGMLDMNVNIRFWVIEGNLIWDKEKDLHMEAEAVVVNGGQFLIGKESDPYTKQGRITLHGHWHTMKLPLCGAKTIFQTMGNIEMHGTKVPVTWTDLAKTAFAGDSTLQVRDSAGAIDWKPGDMVVVATSDKPLVNCRLDRRDGCQAEERYVKEVKRYTEGQGSPGETTLILDRPLVYRHVGEEYEAYLSHKGCEEKPWLCGKTQVRAEVGLLSRNIKVKGSNYEDGSGPAGSEGFGAHLMHAVKAKYTYIEFHWMGQAFQMGRYPLHFHLTGLNPDSKILGCAIHRSFQRGVTVHGTHGALVKDNVLYNHLSHGYFIEDGNEHDNIFENNLGMMTHKSFSMLISDQTPATFWIRNPANYFRNNHAAGSTNFGFWFDTFGMAKHLLQNQFENNTAHSNGATGIWMDILDSRKDCRASHAWTVSVPFRDSDKISRPIHVNAPSCGGPRANIPLISTTTWGNAAFGLVMFETGHVHLLNHRSVSDGGGGVIVWGVVSDNWPDETNGWYGPTIREGAFHATSDLPGGSKCGIGGPWDDTLFVSNVQFVGKFRRGGFCPCFFCLGKEGGYEIRTSKLGWHEESGTKRSPRVNWAWTFSTFFFDFDGTLTEDSPGCKMNGCYLHAPFQGRAGTYIAAAESADSDLHNTYDTDDLTHVDDEKNKTEGGDEAVLIDGGESADIFEESGELAQEAEEAPEHLVSFVEGAEEYNVREKCLQPLVGRFNNKVIPDANITSSGVHANSKACGYGEMFRSRINWRSSSFCANMRAREKWIQWDFGSPKYVTGIQTQGRADSDQWIKAYSLKYSEDGTTWKPVPGPREYRGNGNRNSIQEHRIKPVLATKFRLYPTSWHRHISFRADVLGCRGDVSMKTVCMDKAFLDSQSQDCGSLRRKLGSRMKQYCEKKGHKAHWTALSANQACCACGGGKNVTVFDEKDNSTKAPDVPKTAWKKFHRGGTGFLPPDLCRSVDGTGGIVCDRAAQLNSMSIKSLGAWQGIMPVEVQTDYGFSNVIFQVCYQQYEVTVFRGGRFMIVPPFGPGKLIDFEKFAAEIKMVQGENFVLQWETIHNPDGFAVGMPGTYHKARADMAPVQYGSDFLRNETVLKHLNTSMDPHSAKQMKLDLHFDMYKAAHMPLLDLAHTEKSAGLWGYLMANESYKVAEWYPGSLQVLVSTKGVKYSRNHVGAWSGFRKQILEKRTTRPMHGSGWGAKFSHSHQGVRLAWSSWLSAGPGLAPEKEPIKEISRLEYLVRYCGFNAGSFGLHSDQAVEAVSKHKDVAAKKFSVPAVRKFKWSQWPADLGGKPVRGREEMGFGNVSIEANWEVTLDEDVDFLNKLNISGVLKFADKPGCCKLVARYIFIGPHFGKLEAGTVDKPFKEGKAHIVLKGHPMTPYLKHFRPHLTGSAKWLQSKWIAVMGVLSLHGEPRTKTWRKLAESTKPGATKIKVQHGANFKVGDEITIYRGMESRRIVAADNQESGWELTLDKPLENSYHGLDYQHLGRQETRGMMAAPVGIIDGYSVIVEGEDTPGVPMCDLDENRTCPYSDGLPEGVSLHDFAKEMRFMLRETGRAAHPNCRPCLAVSELLFPGTIKAMAYFHSRQRKCPKDHGIIDARGAAFKHASSMILYHKYDNRPPTPFSNVAKEWAKFPYVWWKDPVWSELKLERPAQPTHRIEKSAFNNTHCGSAATLAYSKKLLVPLLPVTDNTFLKGSISIAGTADVSGRPNYGNIDRQTAGSTNGIFRLANNFLSECPLTSFKGDIITNNAIMAPVVLKGGPIETTPANRFRSNYVSTSGKGKVCVKMMSSKKNGIADNIFFSCSIAVGWRMLGIAEGKMDRMTILDSDVGVAYYSGGTSAERHSTAKIEFEISNTKVYAKADGGGVGIHQPKVSSGMITLPPPFPPWWIQTGVGTSLYFRSLLHEVTWVGFKKSNGGLALAVGKTLRKTSYDSEYHPIYVKGLRFVDMERQDILTFAQAWGQGFGEGQCIQINCDGRRNSLVIDEDGSLLGKPGTLIPQPQDMYDKLKYVDPMGFDTMEDLIPMPARYDRFGDAIPFPSGVDHGEGGGLEYKCKLEAGCDVVFMEKGYWVPKKPELKLPKNAKIVAIREDGGLIRLCPLYHGWAYATGWVRTSETEKTMDPSDTRKPESQHARRYGRVAKGEFGTHRNTSRIWATRGPVYTQPGIFRKGCEYVEPWLAYNCTGQYRRHRHVVIEVMDWNHMTRRWAPVSVEVNDEYAPQGGTLQVMSGPALYNGRLQTFHALGHPGLRHNIYFSGDPPSHMRFHLQYASASEGVVICMYYGLPNNIVAYVNGRRKDPPPSLIPTWDNLKFHVLTTDMPHGTFYYDRVGVETGRPGYLYAVVRGGQFVDFKISHKVILTTKIKVDAHWGGWNGTEDEKKKHFFKKGIDGLVRNIALLIGCPPTRVKILGNGTARKGTFWNEKTTSTEFAKWIWEQNQSMDRMKMRQWLQAPGAKLPDNAIKPENATALLQSCSRTRSFVSQFPEHRQELIASALVRHGPEAHRFDEHLQLMSMEERLAVLERRQVNELEGKGDEELAKLQDVREANETLNNMGKLFDEEMAGSAVLDVETDGKPKKPSNTDCPADRKLDCDTLDLNADNVGEVEIEAEAMGGLNQCEASADASCTLPAKAADSSSVEIWKVTTDDVPTKENALGWLCPKEKYNDGVCDCDCGIWDPDCEPGGMEVAAIHNASDNRSLTLLDQGMVRGLLNWLDADGNGNGVLDGKELMHIDSLGISALWGMANLIVRAEEEGDMVTGGENSLRLGNFAHLQAKESDSCRKMLTDLPFPPGMATYTPMCVKDKWFITRVNMPTGRCALLPKMTAGSQCKVPGDGKISWPIGKDKKDLPSVCGTLAKIYPSGMGAGGIRSAGLGACTAQWTYPGVEFVPGTSLKQYLDMKTTPKGMSTLDNTFSQGMSFYAKINIQSWTNNGRIFAFGPTNRNGNHMRILAYVQSNDQYSTFGKIVFYISLYDTKQSNRRWRHWQKSISAERAGVLGEEDAFLFTYSKRNRMRIWKNGVQLAEAKVDARSWSQQSYARYYIGKDSHERHHPLDAVLSDIRVWSYEVSWDDAVAGTPPGLEPSADDKDEKGEVQTPCIPSLKNAWDFYCDEELPEDVSKEFGYGDRSAIAARKEFAKKQKLGEVAMCGDKLKVKRLIFAGKFGDGLTAEYFRMRTSCNTPPFLFGKLPKKVGIDPEINFEGGFLAPYNEFAIRWTGKLLIERSGEYEFSLGADDGGWVAINGVILVDGHGCARGTRNGVVWRSAKKHMDKGGHEISVLYFSAGPKDGKCYLKYSGPDTGSTSILVPQKALGSAPLRLAALAKELATEGGNDTEINTTIIPGTFVYDEDNDVGIMPAGSCDVECQRGLRKSGGAYFKIYCEIGADLTFKAKVGMKSTQAFIWMDDGKPNLWDLGESSMMQVEGKSNKSTYFSLLQEGISSDSAILGASLGIQGELSKADPGPMRTSQTSQVISVNPGIHTLIFQGRPDIKESFAFKGLSIESGAESCKFFLEGKDKTPQDCR